MAKVWISIDDALLRSLDERAMLDGLSRNEFLTALVERELVGRPSAKRAVSRVRAMVAEATDRFPDEDTTDFIRRMRDERADR